MSVCNLFKPLNENTGSFLLFSQYVEDLTKMSTQMNQYKVSPSKFLACNIDYKEYNNETLPAKIQNIFENGCAFLRDNYSDYNPSISSNLFWRTMKDLNLVTTSHVGGSHIIDQINHVGEFVDLHSYDKHNGMGYAELYCHIPNEAGRTSCVVNEYSYNDNEFAEISKVYTGNEDYLMGWENQTTPLGEKSKPEFTSELTDKEGNPYHVVFYAPVFELTSDKKDVQSSDKSYDINTVILLYDIITLDGEGNINTLYKDIPMGMYIAGGIEDGICKNKVTKVISSDSIFGAGTSYGLRICSRFSAVAGSGEVKIESSNDNTSLCEVMSEFAKSQAKMDEVINNIYKQSQLSKEYLSIFKNTRANVPYAVKVGDAHFWFVNGRNTGITVEALADQTWRMKEGSTIWK